MAFPSHRRIASIDGRKITNSFRFEKIEVSADGLRDIAIMSVELGAVVTLEMFSPIVALIQYCA